MHGFGRVHLSIVQLSVIHEKILASLLTFVVPFQYSAHIISSAAPYGTSRDNCELSDRDTRDYEMANANYFDNAGDYDFYERSAFGRHGPDCMDGEPNGSYPSVAHFCV